MNKVLRTAKKVLFVLGCTILVMGLMTNASIIRAEGEQSEEIQEVEPGSVNESNTTNNSDASDWSGFFNNEENRQTSEDLDNSNDLSEAEQNASNTAAGAVSQDKTAYSPEETEPKEEENKPTTYKYRKIQLDCDGNVISEEELEADTPTSDITLEAEGCPIPTQDRPTNDIPPTSTEEHVVYDDTPAASWVVYLGAGLLILVGAYFIAKPAMSKKAVKQM